jgi:hypothetical protein
VIKTINLSGGLRFWCGNVYVCVRVCVRACLAVDYVCPLSRDIGNNRGSLGAVRENFTLKATITWMTNSNLKAFEIFVSQSHRIGEAQLRYCSVTGRPGDRGSIPGRGERIFPLSSVSRPAMGPTHFPVQLVPVVFSPGLKHGRVLTLTTQTHLVPRSRISRSYL